jgi:hypothetical protein
MELLVVLGGIVAVAWVNWYFFLAQRSADSSNGKKKDKR